MTDLSFFIFKWVPKIQYWSKKRSDLQVSRCVLLCSQLLGIQISEMGQTFSKIIFVDQVRIWASHKSMQNRGTFLNVFERFGWKRFLRPFPYMVCVNWITIYEDHKRMEVNERKQNDENRRKELQCAFPSSIFVGS